MAQKIEVDFGLCESNAVCMGIIPEVFDLDDDDYLNILTAYQRRLHDNHYTTITRQRLKLFNEGIVCEVLKASDLQRLERDFKGSESSLNGL